MKTVIEMAQEAGFETMLRKGRICGFDRDGDYTEELERFAELVRADAIAEEREACAEVCEAMESVSPEEDNPSPWSIAKAIRARSNT